MQSVAPRLAGRSAAGRFLVLFVFFASATPACKTVQRAASEDPMKCERDPKCDRKRGRTADCSRQCSDDPACVDRCEQVQAPNGRLGR